MEKAGRQPARNKTNPTLLFTDAFSSTTKKRKKICYVSETAYKKRYYYVAYRCCTNTYAMMVD